MNERTNEQQEWDKKCQNEKNVERKYWPKNDTDFI